MNTLNSCYKYERKIRFSLKDISVRVEDSTKMDSELSSFISDIGSIYRVTSVRMEHVELSELFYSDKGLSQANILETRIIASITNSLYKNHPLFVDSRVDVLIPYLRLHIDDQMVFFCEIMKLAAKASPKKSHSESDTNSAGNNIFADMSTGDGKKQLRFL